MGDFIKELNIIDFLGILLPGCFLILILCGEPIIISFRESYLSSIGDISISIIIIVSAYVLGSLLHEICDWIEKIFWKVFFFDPKSYASYNVGAAKIIESLPDTEKQSVSLCNNINVLNFPGTMVFIVFIFSLILSLLFPIMRVPSDQNEKYTYLTGNMVFLLIIYTTVIFFLIFLYRYIPQYCQPEIDKIRTVSPYIQTVITEKKNYRKRIVFDGFRVMMRNLLFVFILSLGWHNYNSLIFYSKFLDMKNWEAGFIVAVIGILMAVRYFHYAYLKYKYSFEDFIEMKKEDNSLYRLQIQSKTK